MNSLTRHCRGRISFCADCPFYIVIETSGSDSGHDSQKLHNFLEEAMTSLLVADGTVATEDSKIKVSLRYCCSHFQPHIQCLLGYTNSTKCPKEYQKRTRFYPDFDTSLHHSCSCVSKLLKAHQMPTVLQLVTCVFTITNSYALVYSESVPKWHSWTGWRAGRNPEKQ